MTVLVSGGSGLVGRYIVNGLLAAGYKVRVGGRTSPPADWFSAPVDFVPLSLDPDLEQSGSFDGATAFVHAAFDHLPGRYRGGEGDDAARFRRLNLDGTLRLFQTARSTGVRRCVFLSSRAVYDGLTQGAPLAETAVLSPTSLYGQVKLETEMALARLTGPDFATASLRLTGVYGDLRPNKWDELFADYLSGEVILPRLGTEVHGRDVASAVQIMLESDAQRVAGRSFNVSDLVVDVADILAPLKTKTSCRHPLPKASDITAVRDMSVDGMQHLGWRPAGKALLNQTLKTLIAAYGKG